jgi:nucleotide-binding universal stress UspA family protein
MKQRGKVLVGIDFSPSSAVAAVLASTMAERLGAPLAALHVSDSPAWDWRPDRMGWMGEVGFDPEALIVRPGVPWVELSRYSTEIDAMILVVGAHGCSGFQPIALGSTTTMLLAHARRPILVAPRV